MKLRIVIDTNLWISYLVGGAMAGLGVVFDDPEITLLFSTELLEEFTDVAARPKFKKYFSDKVFERLINLINDVSESVTVESVILICRDPKDNFLLALAVDGNADYLITGDRDLLEIGTVGGTTILSASEFLLRITN